MSMLLRCDVQGCDETIELDTDSPGFGPFGSRPEGWRMVVAEVNDDVVERPDLPQGRQEASGMVEVAPSVRVHRGLLSHLTGAMRPAMGFPPPRRQVQYHVCPLHPLPTFKPKPPPQTFAMVNGLDGLVEP